MKTAVAIVAGVLAALFVDAPRIGRAVQNGGIESSPVKRVEPFTRLTTTRIKPREGAASGTQALCPADLDMCRKFSAFTSHFVNGYTIPLREKELLILRTAWLSRGNYIWGRHNITGKKAGLTDEEISRVTRGPDAKEWSAFDAVLLRAADELHRSRFVSDATWSSLAQRYSENQRVEVVLIVGNYTLLAMFQNSLGLQLEPGVKGLPD